MLESFHTVRRAFRQRLDASISQVLHKSDHLVPGRCPLRKESVAYTLNVATNEKPTCNSGHLDYHPQSNTELDEVQCVARQRPKLFSVSKRNYEDRQFRRSLLTNTISPTR